MKRNWLYVLYILAIIALGIIIYDKFHTSVPATGVSSGTQKTGSSVVPIVHDWYYPLSGTLQRNEYKKFSQYIDNNFYVGKGNLFPSKFIGYHVGADLEIFSGELQIDVPVYAVGNGTIVFAGPVSGYGGLILERLDNLGLTTLYGHIRLSSVSLKVGNAVKAGTQIAVLGNAFSSETGGERKHLHFGIYKGTDLYFKGYETTLAQVQKKWIDPLSFLKQHQAVDVNQK